MFKKFCVSCGLDQWHNEMAGGKGGRCVYCGHPISTNQAKREQQEVIRKQQVKKLGRLV